MQNWGLFFFFFKERNLKIINVNKIELNTLTRSPADDEEREEKKKIIINKENFKSNHKIMLTMRRCPGAGENRWVHVLHRHHDRRQLR